MGTGILAAAWMCLVVSQSPGDVHYTNQRNHEIPVNVQESVRADMREYLLYMSNDQGRNWQQAGNIPATKKGFNFYAPGDGIYWFQVAFVNKAGVQDPDDKTILRSAPHLKMVIDTLKPIVKSFEAHRVGDEVYVKWDVQEDNPDLSREGIRLEYQVKGTLLEQWKAIPFPMGLKGQTSFNPGDKKAMVIRLTVRDLAGNQSYSEAEIAGTIAPAGFNAPGGLDMDRPKLPLEIAIPKQPIEPVRIPPPDYKPVISKSGMIAPPMKEASLDKVVADSRTPEKTPDMVKPLPQFPPPNGGLPNALPPVAAPPTRRLAELQYINQHLIKLQYEVKRVGPSGVGGVEIWLTRDDGASWEPYAKVKEKEVQGEAVQGPQERDFEFSDDRRTPFADGVYGLALVVKNRAGLGKTPRPGDAPEIRVEIDTEKPVVQMFQPIPDPQNPGQLLLKWSAQDKNLTDTPVNLEYAETPKGPWLPIELNVKNTGRFASPLVTGDYSWKVPASTPIQVYLRVRVRDKAGNEGIAATPTPQFVDLVEPEGVLIGILPPAKR